MKTPSLVFTLTYGRRCLRAIQPVDEPKESSSSPSLISSKFIFYPLLLPLVVFFLGCSGEKLPKPTQKGAYTFGCKVNGQEWIPTGRPGFMAPDPIGGGFFDQYPEPLGIYIRAYHRNREVIYIYLQKATPGTYLLNQDTKTMPAAFYPKSYGSLINSSDSEYVTSSKYTGRVTITRADTVQHIISGTFEFTAATPQGDVVRVTDGRFDYKLKP